VAVAPCRFAGRVGRRYVGAPHYGRSGFTHPPAPHPPAVQTPGGGRPPLGVAFIGKSQKIQPITLWNVRNRALPPPRDSGMIQFTDARYLKKPRKEGLFPLAANRETLRQTGLVYDCGYLPFGKSRALGCGSIYAN